MTRLALLVPLIVAAGLRLFRIGLPVLTSDEAFSWRLIQYPVPEMLRRAALDVHPPLYYLALDAWVMVWGTSPSALRGLSALLGVLAVAMAYALCLEASRLDDHGGSLARARRGALLAAVLVAIQAAPVAQGRNARMYALAVLLAGVTSWLLLRALRARATEWRWWLAYGIAVAAFCATHYFAVFTVAAQAIFVMVRARSRPEHDVRGPKWRFVAALALTAALFSPWLPVLARQAEQVRQTYWIPAPSLPALGLSLVQWAAGAELNVGTPLPWLLALAAILGWAWWRGGPGARHLLLLALLPWAFGLAISVLSGRPIVLERYMAFGQFFLICTWGVLWARLPTSAARAFLAAALIVLSAAGLLVTWAARYPDRPTAFWYTARYLKRQAGPGDLVITRSPRALNKLRYYAEQVGAQGLDVKYAATGAAYDDHFSHLPSLEDEEVLRTDPFLERTPRIIWRLEDTRTAPEPAPPGWRITHARMFEGGDAPVILVAGYAPSAAAGAPALGEQRQRGLPADRAQAGEAHLDGFDRARRVEQGRGQGESDVAQRVLRGEGGWKRLAAARGGIRAADLDGQRTGSEAEGAEPARRTRSQGADDLRERRAIRALGADDGLLLDRSRGSGHRDRLLACAARRILEPLRRHLADHLRQGCGVGVADLPEGLEPRLLEGGFDVAGQVGEERQLLAREEQRLVSGKDHEQASRPRPRGRDARREPRGGQAEGRIEAQPPLQLVLDGFGGRHRRRRAVVFAGEVDVGLVRGRALDPAAGREQDGRDVFAEARVGVEVALPEDAPRARTAGGGDGLAGAHPGAAGLGAGGGHDARSVRPGPDDDRAVLERGIEAALDRDQERVEVDVQDAPGSRCALHERRVRRPGAPGGPLSDTKKGLIHRATLRSKGLLVQPEVLLQGGDQPRDHLHRDDHPRADGRLDEVGGLGLLDLPLTQRQHLAESEGEVEGRVLDRAEVAVDAGHRVVVLRHHGEVDALAFLGHVRLPRRV